MLQYKAKYSHDRAREIIDEIGAVFIEKKEHDDFYLKIESGNIWKLQRNDDDVYLALLRQKGKGFSVDVYEYLPKETSNILLPLFKNNQYVLRKLKEFYSWKGSKIELASVQRYGDFIEFYPESEEEKNELLETFGIKEEELVTKSYFSL